MQTAVITGSTGAIGTALCRKLISENVKVYAVCRRGSARVDNIPNGAEILCCDLNKINELVGMIPKADVFFHLAWAGTFGVGRNNMFSQIDNVRYTIDAVNVAHSLGCECFIGAGSQAEYGRHKESLKPETPCFPENGYGMAKLCAGQMSRIACSDFGIRHIWPRILSVYGPNDGEKTMISSVIKSLKNGEDVSLTKGEQMWDYLFSYDVADALFLMWKFGKDGAIYPLGSGEARPLREYVEVLHSFIDSDAKLKFGEIQYNDRQVMYLNADISSLKKDLGWAPKTSFEEGIKAVIASMRN